jgi:hypothetical protein
MIETDPDVIGTERYLANPLAKLQAIFLGDPIDRLGLELLQYLTDPLTCPGTMADLIFHPQGKLGHCLA